MGLGFVWANYCKTGDDLCTCTMIMFSVVQHAVQLAEEVMEDQKVRNFSHYLCSDAIVPTEWKPFCQGKQHF
jgi:hypothetical protein